MKRTIWIAALLTACSDDPPPPPAVTPVPTLLKQADALMEQAKYVQADKLYGKAWNQTRNEKGIYQNNSAFWILMHALDLKVRQGNYQAGMDVARLIGRAFSKEVFMGNPLFHLRVGQCQYETLLAAKRRPARQELSRALIGGGIEMFDGEDPKYLAFLIEELEPPEGKKDWESTRGSGGNTRAQMNAVTGFLAGAIEKKLGRSPPY